MKYPPKDLSDGGLDLELEVIVAGPGVPKPAPRARSLVRLSEVKPREIEWLWPGRVPFGGITNIEGDPGSTKSTLTLDVVARASLGKMPTPGSAPLRSLVIATEDELDCVVVPRLIAAGANLDLVSSHDVDSEDAIWDLVKDLATLEALLVQSEARILVLDPLSSILGPVDSHKDAEVRRALRPLDQLAKRRGIAVLAVRHLRKNTEGSALHAGAGSIGFTGIARAAHLVARDPADPSRFIMAPTKSSYGPLGKSLAYSLLPAWIKGAGGHMRIGWEQSECDLTAEDLRARKPGPAAEKTVEALDWLRAQLADGPVKVEELRQRALAEGLAWRTIERVRGTAKVQAEGPNRDRSWRL